MHCNLVRNKYPQNSKLLYEFVPDKKFGQLISVKPPVFIQCKISDTLQSAESSVRVHLLFCDHSPSFDDFTILTHGNNKFLLEIKENLLIKLIKPELNKNISSASLYLFDTE